MNRLAGLMFGLAALLWPAVAGSGQWASGGFAFSDELGGFAILSVSGSGRAGDPIVVVQELYQATPVTMVIRTLDKPDANGQMKPQLLIQFSLVIVVTNASKRNWAGFDLELQEVRGRPSTYYDGLSFDQLQSFADRVFLSDRFAVFSDLIEPFDRIRFERGYVQHNETVRLKVYVTDVTPAKVFYLVEDPQILLAQEPDARGRHFARNSTASPGSRSGMP